MQIEIFQELSAARRSSSFLSRARTILHRWFLTPEKLQQLLSSGLSSLWCLHGLKHLFPGLGSFWPRVALCSGLLNEWWRAGTASWSSLIPALGTHSKWWKSKAAGGQRHGRVGEEEWAEAPSHFAPGARPGLGGRWGRAGMPPSGCPRLFLSQKRRPTCFISKFLIKKPPTKLKGSLSRKVTSLQWEGTPGVCLYFLRRCFWSPTEGSAIPLEMWTGLDLCGWRATLPLNCIRKSSGCPYRNRTSYLLKMEWPGETNPHTHSG